MYLIEQTDNFNKLVQEQYNQKISIKIPYLGKDAMIPKIDNISEQVLQGLITDVLKDIIQILECESGNDGFMGDPNNMIGNEDYNQNYYGNPYGDNIAVNRYDNNPNARPGNRMDQMVKFEKKGIRVNFNAIKEYLSLV